MHVVSRWLHAPLSIASPTERVHYAMSFLTLPTFMSFVSSTIGVVALSFTEFEFTQVFYFRPLIIVMFTTYYFGCWWLPAFLTILDFDFVKLGQEGDGEGDAPLDKQVHPDPTLDEVDKARSDDSANEKSLLDDVIDEVDC